MILTDEKIRFIKRVTELERYNAVLQHENRTLLNTIRNIQDDSEFNQRYRAISRSST